MTKKCTCICCICGKAFISHAPASKCCGPECMLEWRKQLKERRDYKTYKTKAARTKKAKGPTLTEMAKAARAAGMTYGQYVAAQEQK